MRKKLLACLLVCILALALAVPAMASPLDMATIPTYEVGTSGVYQEITPHGVELTQIYWRTITGGQLQFRVWGMTSGRWLTDWTNW